MKNFINILICILSIQSTNCFSNDHTCVQLDESSSSSVEVFENNTIQNGNTPSIILVGEKSSNTMTHPNQNEPNKRCHNITGGAVVVTAIGTALVGMMIFVSLVLYCNPPLSECFVDTSVPYYDNSTNYTNTNATNSSLINF